MEASKGLRRERGGASVEWGLLVLLIAIVAMTAVAGTGRTLSGTYTGIHDSIVEVAP